MSSLKIVFSMVEPAAVDPVLDAFSEQGITGWTVMKARGKGSQNNHEFLGMQIEPEKEVIVTITDEVTALKAQESAKEAGQLNRPGKGLSVVVDVESAAGLLDQQDK
ncbi:P-II family nitrogen regulator [Salisediminibacterium halotolerans]|uniref:Nitrogen regulatory protein PII n=1 Tax=Salisediminibacterium halotolerans TaxID=517425 RepID=A0A1H9VYG6_9BACI|nr:P-II family nitrogen regulator [Salisediminibacterium haloalkalitolerans]SES26574.1 Nitrogen regulatory protein PII [Salisediminibacterium haloalkalitolerans]